LVFQEQPPAQDQPPAQVQAQLTAEQHLSAKTSTVLTWCFRGDRRALAAIGSEKERAISSVTLMELVQGARSLVEVAEIRLSAR
jgi:predicted nucleic acid-binding protein